MAAQTRVFLQIAFLLAGFAMTCFGQVPQSGHVFIVVEENENASDTIGNPAMPYLSSLADRYGLATNYYANTHPSIGNYFMLTTGQILTNDDNQTPLSFPVSADNIVRELLAAGKSWKAYAESIPSAGYVGGDAIGPDGGQFYTRHVPLPYMTDVQNSAAQRQNIVPFTQFATDLANDTLPNFSFITPNGCDDAHDCALSVADSWLKANIGPLLASPVFQQDGMLVIVFDESATDNTNGGGKVAWVVVSPKASSNFQSSNLYQHQNTLRMMCEALGLSTFPGAAASAADMHEFFGTSSAQQPIAVLNVSPASGIVPLTAVADSSASSSPNGSIASRSINFGDGSISTAVAPSHTYSSAGSFTVQLTVTDNLGLTATASQTVVATAAAPPPAPQAPSCTLLVSPTSGLAPLQVTANATCTDPQKALVSTVISWGDGSSTNSNTGVHIYAAAGSYKVNVTATDSANLTGSTSQAVTAAASGPSSPSSPSSPSPSGPITINGQNGTVVENLHVNNPGGDCVTVTNSTNILIRRSEIGPCGGNGVVISGGSSVGIYDNYIHPEKPLSTSCCDTHDGIFGSGTSSLSIQGNVIAYGEANIELSTVSGATIIGNFLLNPIDSDPSQPADGQSRGQNFQVWGSSSNVTVTNNYTLASADTSKYLYAENQEDSINFGLTSGIVASNNSITGGHSPSGCGLIADTGANSAQFLSNTIVNSGQCGIGIADGTNQVVDSNKILNTTPVNGGGNTAIYVWKVTSSDPPCGPVQVSNNIASAITSSGGVNSFWSGGGCQTVTLTNNTFDAAAASLLSSENLTPPLIPPAPKDCAVTSPFTNNTTVASCGGSVVQPSGPALTLSTTTVILNTTQGAGNPASQNVAITNGGGGTLSWSAVAASSGGWLSVTPANGTGNGELYVGGSSVNLTAGTYQGTVTVTAAGAQNSPQVLQVSLIVKAAAPPSTNEPPSCVLSVSPRNGRAPLLITATASCTSRNTIASTVINWGDGSTVTGTHGTHTYQKAGSYTVKVTATDSSNLTGSASRTVKVKASHSD